MSDHVPLEIQEEIMKRLPIKSVIKFRFVSKPWKSLIDRSEFIADYNVRHTQPQYVVLARGGFSQYKDTVILDYYPKILCSSQGLFCLCITGKLSLLRMTAILWNPSTRHSIAIYLPCIIDFSWLHNKTVVGFGVCPVTSKRKIVIIIITPTGDSLVCGTTSSIRFQGHVLDGISYWLAFDGETSCDAFALYDLFMSFDLNSEEYRRSYVTYADLDLFVSDLRESTFCPVTSETKSGVNKQVYSVYMKQYDVAKLFTKLIKSPHASIERVSGFRKTIAEMRNVHGNGFKKYALLVRKPSSHEISYIRICGKTYSFFRSADNGQLLLLDH